ncbi:MAG: hypothetical protein Q4A05_11310 [Ruminococcus sp.]|nr:hypothetical protein [Ruminococcus sp.]
MNKRKRDIIFLFIITLPVSIMTVYWSVSEQDYDLLPLAVIPPLCVIPVIGLMLLKEKLVLAFAQKIDSRTDSDRRQEALEKFETDSFREIAAETMSADLKSVYRRKFAPRCFLLGALCMAFAAFIALYLVLDLGVDIMPSFFDIIAGVFACLFGIFGISFILESLLQFAGFHVKSFERKYHAELAMIERSYLGGRMMLSPNSGLNIGIDFILYLYWYGCECIRISDVSHAETLRMRTTKRGKAGFVTEQKYEYIVVIYVKGREKPIKYVANELQSEYIRDELARRGIHAIKTYNEKEKYL